LAKISPQTKSEFFGREDFMRKLALIWFIVLLTGISYQSDLTAEETIDPSHPLIIHDFNDKEQPDLNIYEKKSIAENMIKKYYEAEIKAIYTKDTDLHKKGKYLKLEYDVTPYNSEVGYVIPFQGLDITYFDKISFQIKGDHQKGYTDKIKIEIATWNDRISFLLDDISGKWKKTVIDLNDFTGERENFNWEGVERITFIIANLNSEVTKGGLYFDDIKLLPKKDTSITLEQLKLQKFIKPMDRLFKFPEDKTHKINLKKNREILEKIARDTWKFFQNTIDRNTYLVMDNITVGKNITSSKVGDYTNITNIGLQILAVLSAYDLGYIKKKEASEYIEHLLITLKKLKKWKGLFYNYYLTKNGKIANKFISSVDNGWLGAGLICLRNALDGEYKKEATEILDKMNFAELYNPKMGQLFLGYQTDKEAPSKYHYGLLATEPRIASLIGIGKGDIPEEHWFKAHRTLPKEWDWQKQVPKGKKKTLYGVDFFGGYYEYNGIQFVPSWGGSMFESLMPCIVLDEKRLAPDSFGANDYRIVQIHIKYSEEKGFKYWGFSPCSIPDSMGGYKEFGIPVLGTKGYSPDGIVTPHAIILALLAYDEEPVMKNLKKLIKENPDIYGEFGLYDSIDIESGQVTKKYLALDQGMILISLCNFLNKGSIQKKFEKDEIIQNVLGILRSENFFK